MKARGEVDSATHVLICLLLLNKETVSQAGLELLSDCGDQKLNMSQGCLLNFRGDPRIS
jgi:hypothetical protein